jgi:hypothetical protein
VYSELHVGGKRIASGFIERSWELHIGACPESSEGFGEVRMFLVLLIDLEMVSCDLTIISASRMSCNI